jgi:hypothetical protein
MNDKSLLPEGAKCPETWGDLLKTLTAAGFAEDEYLSSQAIGLGLSRQEWEAKPIWSDGTRWIACYWVRGGSEGYYVHIDELTAGNDPSTRDYTTKNQILGKFWDWERAQECANYAQRLINW